MVFSAGFSVEGMALSLGDRFIKAVDSVSEMRTAPVIVVLTGITAAVLFTFVLFPLVQGPFGLGFDGDRYGDLGKALYEYGTMSYYPLNEASIDRGPFYPFVIALLMKLTGGAFPAPVQLFQCLILGLTAYLVFWMGRRLFDERVAFVAGMACALNPMLFWYSARLWVDVILVFQVTLLAAVLISYLDRPALLKAVLIGLILGTGSLNKSILLPFALIIPVGLHLIAGRRVPIRHTLVLAIVTLAVIAPWTLRNYNLTGKFIPIHVVPFYTVYQGDCSVIRFWENPFSVNVMQRIDDQELAEKMGPLNEERKNMVAWEIEYALSNRFLDQSLQMYQDQPWFMVKKIAIHAYMFWFVGADPWKTFAFSALMIPILILFGRTMYRRLKKKGFRNVETLHLGFILLYYGAHLPVDGYVRYSTALIPLMLTYGAGVFARDRELGTPIPQ